MGAIITVLQKLARNYDPISRIEGLEGFSIHIGLIVKGFRVVQASKPTRCRIYESRLRPRFQCDATRSFLRKELRSGEYPGTGDKFKPADSELRVRAGARPFGRESQLGIATEGDGLSINTSSQIVKTRCMSLLRHLCIAIPCDGTVLSESAVSREGERESCSTLRYVDIESLHI